MKNSIAKRLSVGILMFVPMLSMAQTSVEEEIKQKITQYETAVNNSDLDGVVNLYEKDAVLIAPDNLPSAGKDVIHSAYKQIFGAIKLNIKFQFDEVTQLSSDWAIARTRSTGTIKILNGQDITIPESNNELFVLHRDNSKHWNISKYAFNTNTPSAPKK